MRYSQHAPASAQKEVSVYFAGRIDSHFCSKFHHLLEPCTRCSLERPASRSSVNDYECDFGGYLASSPQPSNGGHSAAWTAAIISSTVGSVALVVAALVVVFSCIHLRRRSAELHSKSGLTDPPAGEAGCRVRRTQW